MLVRQFGSSVVVVEVADFSLRQFYFRSAFFVVVVPLAVFAMDRMPEMFDKPIRAQFTNSKEISYVLSQFF